MKGSNRRMKPWTAIRTMLAGATIVVAGCGDHTSPPPQQTLVPDTWQELRRARPELRTFRNSVLLDFEKPTDRVFVTGGALTDVDTATAHTGSASLRAVRASHVDIKLSSLMSGRPLPGEWTLLGAHVMADRNVPVQAQYVVDGKPVLTRTQTLTANQWTPVMLDIIPLPPQVMSIGQTVYLRITPAAPTTLYVDDVMLIDNHQQIVDDEPWSIRQAGHTLSIEHAGKFSIELESDAAGPQGWALLEASRVRAIVAQEGAKGQRWVIYRDGRRYIDGSYAQSLDRQEQSEFGSAYAAQHQAPAAIEIAEEDGALVRRSTGDANNDGYNEWLGAYMIQASKPRLDIRITPRTSQLVHPVFEIRGLPQGRVIATLEGQIIDQLDRLEDGTVLLVLSQRLQRPATLNVRVQ